MKKVNLKDLFRKDICNMAPYIPGESAVDLCKRYGVTLDKLIKLNANENPYVPSFFNYYPSPAYKSLREEIAKYANVSIDQIILGNGSDEIIDLLMRLTLNKEGEVISTPPTFGMYEILAKLNYASIVSVPRKADFSLDCQAILKKINKSTKMVFICNPNNPTGNITKLYDLEMLLKSGKLIIVDEAYFEFAKFTCTGLLSKYSNLVILRTFSKWAALAGLRVGYALADSTLVCELMKIKLPYTINSAGESAAVAVLKNQTFSKKIIKKIINEREKMYKKISLLKWLKVYPSGGNFLFLQIKDGSFLKLKETFEENKIALRYYDNPLIPKSIRITIGKPEQNNKVIKILNGFKFPKINKFAFLDRDGTLIFEPQDTYKIDSIEKLKILDGVIKSLRELIDIGYELIMVTNQDGLGKSSFPKTAFEAPQNMMLNIFEKKGIKFKKIFICPHVLSENCDCRKPKIGLVKEFLESNQLVFSGSFMCGDRDTDQLFAKKLKIKFIPMQTNGNFFNALRKGGII